MGICKRAMTVDGPVSTDLLGVTYVHEHLMVKPQLTDPKWEAYTLDDEEKSGGEALSFRRAGGGTLVEMTPIHYGRNVAACRRIARRAGVRVICCTGFHEEQFLPPWFSERTDEELLALLRREVLEGMDGTGIRPGVVKLGTSLGAVTPNEKRSIRLVAAVHLETGIPISTHCARGTMGEEQLDLLQECGVDPSRVLLCHIDSRLDVEYAKRLCQRGANISIDHIGRDLAHRDRDRVQMVKELVRAGFSGQVMLSGDMGKKEYLPSYGGTPGFSYILTGLREALLEEITPEDFYRLTTENPARFFGWLS